MPDPAEAETHPTTWTWLLVAALAVAGCVPEATEPAQPTATVIAAPPPKPQPTKHVRHPPAPRPVRKPADVEAEHVLAQAAARVQGPLDAYGREPAGSCDSKNLMIAELWAGGFAESFTRASTTAQRRFYGELALDVADTARRHGCPAQARGLYDSVLQTYVDADYAELRQRAEHGLAALQEMP